jgi:hypothetical protein
MMKIIMDEHVKIVFFFFCIKICSVYLDVRRKVVGISDNPF